MKPNWNKKPKQYSFHELSLCLKYLIFYLEIQSKMKIQFLMILLIFIFASLVSAFINMNSSFSDNEREFDVKWNSSLNFKLPDHSKPTFDDSVTNFIWIIFGVFTVSTLLFGCFCCLVICWMIYGVQTGGGYGGHHGLRYGGYGQPLMPFGHRYHHRFGMEIKSVFPRCFVERALELVWIQAK